MQAWVEVAVAGVRLFLMSQVDGQKRKAQRYLLTVAVPFDEKADNRIFNLRIIGPASKRLAL